MLAPRNLAFLALVAALACSEVTGPAVVAVTITPDSAALYVGQTRTFSAVARDIHGDSIASQTVEWRSSDTTIATISPAGVLTGVRVGAVTLSATIDRVTGTAKATIRLVPVISVTIAPVAETLFVGQFGSFSATPKDSAGGTLTGRTVAWTSTDNAVATVSAVGVVTTKTVGQVWIRATVEGRSDSAEVLVGPAPDPSSCADTQTIGVNSFNLRLSAGVLPPYGALSGGGFYKTVPTFFGGGVLYGTSAATLVLGYDLAGTIPSNIPASKVCLLSAPATESHTYASLAAGSGASGFGSVAVSQETFAFQASAPDSGYVLVRYTLINRGATPVPGVYVGFTADWDLLFFNSGGQDVIRWNAGLGLGEAVKVDTVGNPQIMGVVPIGAMAGRAFKGWLNGGDPTDYAGYFAILTGGVNTTTPVPGDIRELVGVGPQTLQPGQRLMVYFAIVGADDRARFNAAVARAQLAAQTLGF